MFRRPVIKSLSLFQTKPLGVIWGKYGQYSEKNSIIIDDLRRNFLMNPKNGLKVFVLYCVTQKREPTNQAHKLDSSVEINDSEIAW